MADGGWQMLLLLKRHLSSPSAIRHPLSVIRYLLSAIERALAREPSAICQLWHPQPGRNILPLVKNLRVKPLIDQQPGWPAEAKALLAQYDAETVVVYQAYKPKIGHYAARHGHFGDGFNLDRMSWIKPGFMWMMHRSEWGTAPGQEVVLALWLKRDAFDTILSRAVRSSFHPAIHASQEEWHRDLTRSEVRVQWDPDWDARDIKQKRRVIQLGLSGETLRCYAREWLIEVQDISDFVREQARYRRQPDMLLTPAEKRYPVSDRETARRLGIGLEDA